MAAKPECLSSPALQEPFFTIIREPTLLGLPAKEFLLRFLVPRTGIEKVSFVVYAGKLAPQNICWAEIGQVPQILAGSRCEALELLLGERFSETSELTPAVGSLVICRGKPAHILQMDFIHRLANDNDLLNRVSYFLGSGKWVIVYSGLSYHAWGVHKLASVGEWKGFMGEVRKKCDFSSASDDLVPNKSFLTSSLRRGFSALRVHEIPSPKIVGLVDSF